MLLFRFMTGIVGKLGLVNPLRGIIDPLCIGSNPKPSDVALRTWPRNVGYAGRIFPVVNSLWIRLPLVDVVRTRFACLADDLRSFAKVES